MPLVGSVMTEFWTHDGKYSPYELDPTVAALRKSGQNLIEVKHLQAIRRIANGMKHLHG